MPYLVGTDEAGYGPNLGPLTISVTAWHVLDAPSEVDLYQRLSAVITEKASRDDRLAMADSKVLYKPGGGVRQLERGLLSALGVAEQVPNQWQQMWETLQADPKARRHRLPWYEGYDCRLPLDVTRDEIGESTKRLSQTLQQTTVRLVTIRSRAVFPEEFNDLVDDLGTKGAVLSRLTMELLAQVLAELEPEPVLVICDKHGGRNRYQEILQRAFPGPLVEVHGEGRAESIYRWGPADCRVEVQFRTGGEEFLPAALASMACKYLRELSMRAFNEFWCQRVPGLRPTAGYPLDAKRFQAEIVDTQKKLKIDPRVLWRNR